MNVYVIRHGITELNKEKIVNAEIDEPLALEGIEQVKKFTKKIPKSVIHMFSSPLLRATQTASLLSSDTRRYTKVKELSEIKMGTLAGKSWKEMNNGNELKNKHRSVTFDYRKFGGENVENVKKRLFHFLNEINGNYNDFEVLLITHGGIIRVLNVMQCGYVLNKTVNHLTLFELNIDNILNKETKLL